MQTVLRVDTRPELGLRSALHRLGLQFRVDLPPLSGMRRRADVVFKGAKVACFVHGCFWHGCPEHLVWPKRNSQFWRAKILANRRRDTDTAAKLARAGWRTVVCWEHDDPDRIAATIASLVRARPGRRTRTGWARRA